MLEIAMQVSQSVVMVTGKLFCHLDDSEYFPISKLTFEHSFIIIAAFLKAFKIFRGYHKFAWGQMRC